MHMHFQYNMNITQWEQLLMSKVQYTFPVIYFIKLTIITYIQINIKPNEFNE